MVVRMGAIRTVGLGVVAQPAANAVDPAFPEWALGARCFGVSSPKIVVS